jgi:hypothetical protein
VLSGLSEAAGQCLEPVIHLGPTVSRPHPAPPRKRGRVKVLNVTTMSPRKRGRRLFD